jgi:NAD-dependent dihydropyrimidine dehydrogenase PreA subunit
MREESLTGEKDRKLEDIKKEAETKRCSVQKALYLIEEFIAGPMCGKCFPCALGTFEARAKLRRISRHPDDISESDILVLNRIGLNMIEGAFCKKGRDTGKFIVDKLANSGEEFKEHIDGICSKKECVRLIKYIINPDVCNMCGKCLEACRYGAIIGEKRQSYLSGYLPFEIRQERCTKCGECIKVCPEGAIEVVTKAAEEFVKG